MPDQIVGARGPGGSPDLRWYPVVTMLQLAVDIAIATTTPIGYGHVYAPEHYVDAWIAASDVQGWSAKLPRGSSHLPQKMVADLKKAGEETSGANRGG
jgi:uncharacterized membrane protein